MSVDNLLVDDSCSNGSSLQQGEQKNSSDILFIDKPKGITSFGVIRELRKKLNIKKMGHAGTLDPLATGLLIIACGKATKRISEFMGLPKEYVVDIEFGKTSNTYDADGSVTPHAGSHLPEFLAMPRSHFESFLPQFIGDILQTPPIFSALKVKGRRAYDLARTGQAVHLEPRKVHVSSIEILDFSWPIVRLRIACSKGTYIRSIAHDLGQVLGCGGYVKELRRTKIGGYRVEDAQLLVN